MVVILLPSRGNPVSNKINLVHLVLRMFRISY
jgi:hypothetical protein